MTSKAGVALVCIIIICIAVGALVWSGRFSLPGTAGTQPPMQNVISLWNKTLIPSDWPTVLTASFTLPSYSSAVLHVEWALSFRYQYSGDRVSVQTVLSLDGVQIDNKPYSYTLNYQYEKSLTVSANAIHTVRLALVIMINGPCYSTFNETATGWISYKK